MWATADLMDEPSMAAVACEQPLQQYGGVRQFAGVVRTVRCREDVSLVRSLLETDGSGRVLVVDGGGSLRSALMGDHMAGSAVANGWAGVVVHGAVRDVRELGKLRLGVKALGSNPRRSGRCEPGEVDVPVMFGNVTFHPGDYVVSDDDGIAVLSGGRTALGPVTE